MHPPLFFQGRSRPRRLRPGKILAVGCASLLILVASVAPFVAPSPVAADPPNIEGSDLARQRQSLDPKPIVYLTFDDGPVAVTGDVLALLGSYDIKATFFMTGQNTLNSPDLAVQTVVEGHAIANHTYNHGWLTRTNPDQQLGRAQEIIERVTGTSPTCYRPPYGATNDQVRASAAKLGLTEWLWDLDTHDWKGSVSAAEMVSSLDHAANYDFSVGLKGTNVLMHDGGDDGDRTVEALTTWLSVNHDRYDFRIIEGCGGQPSDPDDTTSDTTIDVSATRSRLTEFQVDVLYKAFIAQGIDVEAWNVYREAWQDRIVDSSSAGA